MNTLSNTPEHLLLILEKADKSLIGSANLIDDGLFEFAVSRAYYAAFYAIEAALITRDITTVSHKSIIVLFNREFIHTGIMPPGLNRSLNRLFKERQNADYSYLANYTREDCELQLQEAKLLVAEVRKYLTDGNFLPNPHKTKNQ
ncbi:MAG: HEPN domain-containing protein [Candidatus Kapabacteria bacterium]|nr:HEPN domain-containing protein [Candidatus Kapabacteria bacterium]